VPSRSAATRSPAPQTAVRPRKVRLDHLVLARRLAPSRHQAEAAIRAGEVYVEGRRLEKPGLMVSADAAVERRARRPAYVSRGGAKLAAALEAFGIDLADRVVLDVGASTGGFTDCALQRGARRVYAVDVGRGQLHWRLRQDPRVVSMEGRHAARLQPGDLPEVPDVAAVDCSFISVLKVLPAVGRVVRPGGPLVVLVKPQFEVGPRVARRGVVRDPAAHEAVLRRVIHEAAGLGLVAEGVIASPLLGPEGNREFFVMLRERREGTRDVVRIDMDATLRHAVYGREGPEAVAEGR
jgi:23S rRNA (cytidine1920-2'-O)/16S rRNA (cytidine1409-2'-O)-methyltransferase